MKLLPLVLLSVALIPPFALAAKPAVDYPATYAGGSLPLSHNKVRASFEENKVVFMQGSHRIAVPAKDITEISCGSEVHRRLPLMHLGTIENRYIGVAWAGGDGNKVQVLLKLNRAEYSDFLTALEQFTGIKAVNTNNVPTVVHYQI